MTSLKAYVYVHSIAHDKYYSTVIALFPGPAQLFVAISMEKCEEPGIFSHVSMT